MPRPLPSRESASGRTWAWFCFHLFGMASWVTIASGHTSLHIGVLVPTFCAAGSFFGALDRFLEGVRDDPA